MAPDGENTVSELEAFVSMVPFEGKGAPAEFTWPAMPGAYCAFLREVLSVFGEQYGFEPIREVATVPGAAAAPVPPPDGVAPGASDLEKTLVRVLKLEKDKDVESVDLVGLLQKAGLTPLSRKRCSRLSMQSSSLRRSCSVERKGVKLIQWCMVT
eukprot:7548875-Karenia_brevis.AAC.1